MAARPNSGEASAPPNVLAFPKRNRGRTRQSNAPLSMGAFAVAILRRDGLPVPGNVALIEQPSGRDEGAPERSEALLLALAIFTTLTREQKRQLRRSFAVLAAQGDEIAQRLENALEGGTRP